MKNSTYLLLISLLIGCNQNNSSKNNFYDSIPSNTVLIIKVNDFETTKNNLNNQKALSSIINIKEGLKKTISVITPENISGPSLYCFTPYGKDKIAITLIYKIPLEDSISTKKKSLINYNDVNIEKVNSYFKARIGDLGYISNSQLILENSIRLNQDKTQGIQSTDFYKLTKTLNEKSPVNFLIKADARAVLNDFFYKTPLFPSSGNSWISFDLNIKRNPFALDGLSFINDSIPDKLTLIKEQKPKELNIPEIIPQNFTSLLTLSVSDLNALEENFIRFSRQKNTPLNKIDFSAFNNIDEIGWMNYKKSNAIFFHLKNNEHINNVLYSEDNFKKTYRTISYFKKNLPKDFISFSSNFSETNSAEWVLKINDFIVFSESENLIKNIIGNYKDDKTLKSDINFNTLKSSLASKSTYLWIGQTKNLKEYWESNSSEASFDEIPYEKYPILAMQGVNEGDYLQMRITAQENNPKKVKKTVVNQYNFSLKNHISNNPQWLLNHRTKTMDIAIQDIENNLYLFSNTGNLFWKKKLSGKIIGPIKQVDLYNNKRLQMAFNTSERFLIMDRNGKEVSPFKIKISNTGKTNPLSVFDYDMNNNYRFLISNGSNINLYDKKGEKVNGFKLKKTKYSIPFSPKHFRIKNKDYIIIPQNDGSIIINNRKGEERIKVKEKINFSNNEIFLYRDTFATTDLDGNLVQIDLKGNVLRSPLNLNSDHKIDMISKTLVSISDNILTINGIPISLPFGNYSIPKIFYVNNTIYISITDFDSKKVYLFLSNGTLINGFPVYGNSLIDLSNSDSDKELEVLVKSEEDSIIVYQIN